MVRKVKKHWIHKIHLPHWLTIFIGLLFVLRVPSFFEPFSYGDEMIYLTLGQGIRKGLVLYRDIHDNKPPLLYFLAAISGNVFWFRVILAFWMSITVALFWKLTRLLFPKNGLLQKFATVVFGVMVTIPLLEGQIANAEVFMIGLTIASFLIAIKKKAKLKDIYFAGFLFGLAVLFKIPSLFDLWSLLFIWVIFFVNKKLNRNEFIQKPTLFIAGAITPIILSLLWYFMRGALDEYIQAAFLQNVGYVSSWRPGDIEKPFLVKNGPLLIRASIVTFGSGLMFLLRKRLSWQYIFVSMWLLTSLFGITLSERPYPHYLIQAMAPGAILVGILVAKKDVEQSLAIIPLALLAFVPVYFHFWHYPVSPYYGRFMQLSTGKINHEQYFDMFEGGVNENYRIAKFIASSTSPNDRIFVWGDQASTIYALSRRVPPIKYVANYHISDFSSPDEVIDKIKLNPPTIIVILSGSKQFTELFIYANTNYIPIENIDGSLIYKKMSPRLLQKMS